MLKEELMRRALALACSHNPAPNPRVGAVLVKGGRIIGEGAHHRPGASHAEINAIAAAGAAAAGAGTWQVNVMLGHQPDERTCLTVKKEKINHMILNGETR